MAKRPTLNTDKESSLLSSTAKDEPEQNNSDLNEGRIVASGVGLKEGELAAIEALAAEYGITKNAFMRLAIRRFVEMVRRREIDLNDSIEVKKTETRKPKY